MGIDKKLKLLSNTSKLYLFDEGMFYRLYNQNALWFINNIKSYRVNVKFIKSVNQEVKSIGFPKSYLNELKIEGKLTNKQIFDTYIVYDIEGGSILKEQEYKTWSNSLNTDSVNENAKENLVELIKNFDTLSKTPIQVYEFLIKLKEIVNI